jgi:hypothetical protein
MLLDFWLDQVSRALAPQPMDIEAQNLAAANWVSYGMFLASFVADEENIAMAEQLAGPLTPVMGTVYC